MTYDASRTEQRAVGTSVTHHADHGDHGDHGVHSDEDDSSLDILGFLQRHRHGFVSGTLIVGLLTVGVMAVALALPRTDRYCALDITPVFIGAAEGRYPNKTVYAPQDILANYVVEPVWRAQKLEKVIPLMDLSRNLQVAAGGADLELTRSTYLQKLSNTKLTSAERSAIEAEFTAKLKSINSASLTITLGAAGTLTDEQMTQFVLALPEEWARATDASGARSYDYPLPMGEELRLSAAGVAIGATASSAVVHAERMKEFSDSLMIAIESMSKLNGSDGIKDKSGASIVDLGHQLNAVRRNQVIPAYIETLREARRIDPVGYQAIRSSRTRLLESELTSAKERARVLREAFEGYSDETRLVRGATGPRVADEPHQAGLMANIDGTFIDRVIEQAVKIRDVEYRRELTDRRLQAELDVVRLTSNFEFEAWLETMVDQQVKVAKDPATHAAQMQLVSEAIATFADRAREIMATLAARNLNASAAMYRMDTSPMVRAVAIVPIRSIILYAFACWTVAMAWVALRGIVSDRRQQRSMARFERSITDEFRQQSAGVLMEESPARSAPRRLPESRQPVG
jgi:hypothetical protein